MTKPLPIVKTENRLLQGGLQADLNQWLVDYNEQRTHSGKYCYGKTPMQMFRDTLHLAKE